MTPEAHGFLRYEDGEDSEISAERSGAAIEMAIGFVECIAELLETP